MKGERITNIPGLNYLWKVDNLYLAGQPSDESWDKIKEAGVTKVINIRGEDELDFSKQVEILASHNIEYLHIPVMKDGALDENACLKINQLIEKDNPQMIHCGSANRVAGWLMTYLTLEKKIDFEDAVEIAENNGLSNPGFIDQAQKICKANQQ